jgi:hypothetical protein
MMMSTSARLFPAVCILIYSKQVLFDLLAQPKTMGAPKETTPDVHECMFWC